MAEKNAARILVVEDERNVGLTLVERLQREGFEVEWAVTAADARRRIGAARFDLAVLDVGLPDGSGFDIAEVLRKDQGATAIVFLTAFGNPEDRVRGLELGAEDYVAKPFHLKELMLRVGNALKRGRYLSGTGTGTAAESVKIGRARVNFSAFEAETDGKSSPLTHKECALLKFLHDRRGKVVSRDEILDEVWSEDEFPSSRTVDNFIMRLRRLIEVDPENPQVIRSVRGIGYLLSVDAESERS